jgi:haloalkane dehalogenase
MTHTASTTIATIGPAKPLASATLPAWLDPVLFPFESHFADVGGHHIHYVDEGVGPVLLFVHSAPSWSFYYRELILALRGRFRCIALDLPGWGLSSAASGFGYSLPEESNAVELFIEKLGLRDITLAVHDSGGPIALSVAARHPEWFRAFILTSTFGWSLTDYPKVRFMLRLASSWPFRLLNAAFNLFPRLVASYEPKQRKLSEPERVGLTRVFDTWQRRDRILLMLRELVRQPDYLNALELAMRSKLSDRPALIAFGEGDPVREFDQRWADIFPRHRRVIIDKELHFAHLGAARDLVANILSFWDELVDRQAEHAAQ